MPGPFQTADAWTDALLDPMREVGDGPADAAIAAMFAAGDVASVNTLMRMLVANDGVVPDTLPEVVKTFLATTEDLPPWADAAKIAIAERLFWEWGPELILVLLCYALPFCYAGRKGVQVLALTSRLSGNAVRRLVETAQMLVDVLQPGGLTSADGRGRRTVQKVRLMHAAVRKLAGTSPQWNAEWGLPINQEDLTGTLMSFSWISLDGLRILGIQVSEEQQEAYLHFWNVIGEQLGLREDLVPVDMNSGKALAAAIARRQFAASDEGKMMTSALIAAIQHQLPGNMLDSLPAAFIEMFLGKEIAAMLGVAEIAKAAAVHGPAAIFGKVLTDLNRNAVMVEAAEKASRLLVYSGLLVDRGGNRPAFSIPTELKEQWGINWLA